MTYIGGQRGHGPVLYVCHRPRDVELVALLVDFLEASVPALEGLVGCSALPGYPAAEPMGCAGLRVIALLDGGPHSAALSGRAARLRERGARVRLLSAQPAQDLAPPPALCDLPVQGIQDALLTALAEDLAAAVSQRHRESETAEAAREELMLCAYRASVVAGSAADPAREGAPVRVFARPVDLSAERTPASDTLGASRAANRISTQLPAPRPPSALLCVNAGAALGGAVFRDAFDETDLVVLDGEFAEFLHGFGGDWFQLRASASSRMLLRAVGRLLQGKAGDTAHAPAWYEAGYQLSRFGHLCACDVKGDAGVRSAQAQARGRAWNAFWNAASQLSLGEHTVMALSALLEDADAPGGPRVETVQCLEVLRNAAYDWDCRRRMRAIDRQVEGAGGDGGHGHG